MALDYDELKKQYMDFTNPHAAIKIDGKDLIDKNEELALSDIIVDLTCGYEASVASFCIYNIFDRNGKGFVIDKYSKFIALGASIEIAMGYSSEMSTVFVGVITKVNFVYDDPMIPYVRITAMDAKGLMMANNYSRQLMATSIDAAVKEILQSSTYTTMSTKGIIKSTNSIESTPDNKAGGGQSDEKPTIEMVAESDYEFIVKLAKKVNFEFFVAAGNIIFRKAKVDTDPLMTVSPSNILRSFDIEYDITGQVSEVEVRATDTEKAELITSKKMVDNKWSYGKSAGKLIKGNKKVYLDASVHTQAEADMRAESLVEEYSYRFGTLNCDTLGLPELVPGKFIEIDGLGKGASNTFYLYNVRHVMSRKGEYKCAIEAKAKELT